MFHTAAFSSSIANTGDLLQLTEIPDSILPASGLGLLSNQLAYLHALGFVGADLIRGQMQAPSLRDYGNQDVEPINLGTAFESPPRLDDFSRNPIPLAAAEEWDLFAAQGNAMASEIETGFLWCSDGKLDPYPSKKVVQIKWTASITLVASGWSLIQLTMAQPLAAGMYALVGARCVSAGALAFRFVQSGGKAATNSRPGGIACQTVDQLDWPLQRKGGWGKWLDFTNTTVPQMEIFSLSNDTSEEGIIDIVPY
jgi:hypothetical protein